MLMGVCHGDEAVFFLFGNLLTLLFCLEIHSSAEDAVDVLGPITR